MGPWYFSEVMLNKMRENRIRVENLDLAVTRPEVMHQTTTAHLSNLSSSTFRSEILNDGLVFLTGVDVPAEQRLLQNIDS